MLVRHLSLKSGGMVEEMVEGVPTRHECDDEMLERVWQSLFFKRYNPMLGASGCNDFGVDRTEICTQERGN